MQLTNVRITNYKSITDSGDVPIADITALVGKNESGKTAFLQALHLLNPLNPIRNKTKYNDVTDYPSKAFSSYKRSRKDNPAKVVTATFELNDKEVEEMAALFGPSALKGRTIKVSKGYDGSLYINPTLNASAALDFHIDRLNLGKADRALLKASKNGKQLLGALKEFDDPDEATQELIEELTGWREQDPDLHAIDEVLYPALPKFFYFDDYSIMPGRVSLEHLETRRNSGDLKESEKTFLSLLGTVEADLSDFAGADFEELTRELEAAANGITEQVFEFWSQNSNLSVNIQISQANPGDDPPLDSGHIFNVRILNQKHSVTVPFDERSRGFVWFFSFFAYFANLPVEEDANIILLLDEPGVSLHAKAQADFLRFIEERLSVERQVIYTTHSPFLIDAQRIDRVRTVEDKDGSGTKVSADVLGTDDDTVFPLQAALGYELAQSLFLGPNALLVEGPSDLIYLQLFSAAAESAGLTALDPRWVITPVGGASNLATFISLIGSNQLNLAVLMDASTGDQQKVRRLQDSGHLRANSLFQISQFSGSTDSDIEDLLPTALYLDLVNGAYSIEPPLQESDLTSQSPRVVVRVAELFKSRDIFNGRLNHMRPASYLLKEQTKLLKKIPLAKVRKMAELFEALNGLLP